jgi:hypothetical protein
MMHSASLCPRVVRPFSLFLCLPCLAFCLAGSELRTARASAAGRATCKVRRACRMASTQHEQKGGQMDRRTYTLDAAPPLRHTSRNPKQPMLRKPCLGEISIQGLGQFDLRSSTRRNGDIRKKKVPVCVHGS